MAIPIIPTFAACLLVSLAIYRWIITPAILSPLAKIPSAHWTAPFSSLWILYYRLREEETPVVHEAHQRLGPIVRLAPNEVSVNSVDGGIRSVYAGGYEKGDWYRNVFLNYGVEPMFAMSEHGRHSRRRKLLSNIYAKSTLQSSAPLAASTKILFTERLIPRLSKIAKSGQTLEIYDVFAATTMDLVNAYIFGLKNIGDFVENPEIGKKFCRDFKALQRYRFWPQELPKLTGFLDRIGLKWIIVPRWIARASKDVEAWILDMCDKAEATFSDMDKPGHMNEPEDYPSVYVQLRNALLKDALTKSDLDASTEQLVRDQRLEVASEMLDHSLAGFDTSSITLTFLAWELSRPENKHWQDEMHAEISALPDIFDAKAVDNLPIMQAILMETLRLHAAIPGNQPRVTPPSSTLGAPGHEIAGLPPGVRVQAQAWSLHREPSVFPEPETWNPARWLPSSYPSHEAFEAQHKEMSRWFWAFGSGGRMCVGSNLAMYDMKIIIAAIWNNFRTELAYGEGMVHRGGYVAEPIGKNGNYCVLKIRELEAAT